MKDTPYITAIDILSDSKIPFNVTRGKGHYKIKFESNGRKFMYVCSSTPSDFRSIVKTKVDIKRMLKPIQG